MVPHVAARKTHQRALRIFVRHPKKTFATISARSGYWLARPRDGNGRPFANTVDWPPLTARKNQDGFFLSRNGLQETAPRLASSKCPSSNNLPTHLKHST